VLGGLKAGFQSPLLWAPVIGILVVLVGFHVPQEVASSFSMIGSATSGVAVFTVGLTLAAHSFHLSKTVLLGAVGRVTLRTVVLLVLFDLLRVSGPFAREAGSAAAFPWQRLSSYSQQDTKRWRPNLLQFCFFPRFPFW
jgi:malonate transporter and related proteins